MIIKVKPVIPESWDCEINAIESKFNSGESKTLYFTLKTPFNLTVRRARIALDITIDGQKFGQQAEALVTVKEN